VTLDTPQTAPSKEWHAGTDVLATPAAEAEAETEPPPTKSTSSSASIVVEAEVEDSVAAGAGGGGGGGEGEGGGGGWSPGAIAAGALPLLGIALLAGGSAYFKAGAYTRSLLSLT